MKTNSLKHRVISVLLAVALSPIPSMSLYGAARPSRPVRDTRVPAAASHFAKGQSALGLPFALSNNIILIQAKVNNSRPLWFMFDTGANSSVINTGLVKELNLKLGARVQGKAAGGNVEAEVISGVSLSIGGATASNQTIAALPLDVFSAALGKPIAGIIGYDFIKQFVVEVDYAAKVMRLYRPTNFKRPVKGEILPITFINRKPFVKAKIKLAGRDPIEGTFMIDTASDGVMSVNAPFVKTQQMLNSVSNGRQTNSAGAGGVSKSIVARVQNIQLNGFIINNPLVEFSLATEGNDTISSYQGLLGGEVFRRFTMTIDYSRQRIILKRNRYFDEPVEVDMSGIDLMAEPDDFKTLVVNEVAAGSPAAVAGVKEEDQLLEVDGRPVSEIGLDQVRQWFKQNGKEHLLTIKRGEQVLHVKIKLSRSI